MHGDPVSVEILVSHDGHEYGCYGPLPPQERNRFFTVPDESILALFESLTARGRIPRKHVNTVEDGLLHLRSQQSGTASSSNNAGVKP
jgi:hypothetical protein